MGSGIGGEDAVQQLTVTSKSPPITKNDSRYHKTRQPFRFRPAVTGLSILGCPVDYPLSDNTSHRSIVFMKATNELKNEHQGVKLMLRVLRKLSAKAERGEYLAQEHLDGILEFLTVFVDTCHHGKEEEFLFPALETAGLQKKEELIGALLEEHEQGRLLVSDLRKASASLQKDPGDAGSFCSAANEYAMLLTKHIDKEDNELFPWAETMLSEDTDTKLFDSFEKLERERIGAGKHEAFHELLEDLEREYLS